MDVKADAQYPLLREQQIEALCVGARVYRDPQFRAWKCKLDFVSLAGDSLPSMFLHLGIGRRPHAGRRSRYYRDWQIALADGPRRAGHMPEGVFCGKHFLVEIGTVSKRFDGEPHAAGTEYSTVKRIVRRIGP